MWNWLQPKSFPWWAGVGPFLVGWAQLFNHLTPGRMGLAGALLDAGLDGTPAFAMIWLGMILIWAQRKYFPHL